MHGFLNLNKPSGWTSHDCVAKVRKLLRLKKVGHGGTLDPAATGVLPIAIGKCTRLLQYLRSDKAYTATVRFGVTTTTDDLEGEVLTRQPVGDLSLETVRAELAKFTGNLRQIPPKYSAIQVGGKRLYDLARSGEDVEVPEREVEVYDIQVRDWKPGEFPEIEFDIACGAGTYIRAIARDLGEVLGTGGTLAKLVRSRSSGFDLGDSLTLEALGEKLEAGTFEPVSPRAALQHLPHVIVPETEVDRWLNGQRLSEEDLVLDVEPRSPLRVESQDDRFLGIGEVVVSENLRLLVPKLVFTL